LPYRASNTPPHSIDQTTVIQLIGVLKLIVNHDVLRIFRAEVSKKEILFRRCSGRVFVSHKNLAQLLRTKKTFSAAVEKTELVQAP
jgi:hypothetical protein